MYINCSESWTLTLKFYTLSLVYNPKFWTLKSCISSFGVLTHWFIYMIFNGLFWYCYPFTCIFFVHYCKPHFLHVCINCSESCIYILKILHLITCCCDSLIHLHDRQWLIFAVRRERSKSCWDVKHWFICPTRPHYHHRSLSRVWRQW